MELRHIWDFNELCKKPYKIQNSMIEVKKNLRQKNRKITGNKNLSMLSDSMNKEHL